MIIIYYTGIGSRKTPNEILSIMKEMAVHLAREGYTLRSGGADGADLAFEEGCDAANGSKEIFLPWTGFNGSNSNLIGDSSEALNIAREFHPYWYNLSQGARKLQARNSHQVLGQDLNTKSRFIICYTKRGLRKGGTGQALRIAEFHSIPIFDCGLYEEDIELLEQKYKEFWRSVNNEQ